MAIRIESITHEEVVDKRCLLYNAQIARRLSIGNDWNTLRVGFRFSFADVGYTIQPSFLSLGLMSNPNSGLTNGPINVGNVSHFLGYVSKGVGESSIWSRNTSSGVPYYHAVNTYPYKVVGATEVQASRNAQTHYSGATHFPRRQVMIFEYVRLGGGDIQVGIVWPSTAVSSVASNLLDVALKETLIGAMEVPVWGNVATFLNTVIGATGYAVTTVDTTLAVDEATDGPLNSIVAAWNRSIVPCVLSDVMWRKVD